MVTNIKPCNICNDYFVYNYANEEICTQCFIKLNKTSIIDRILIYTMIGILAITVIVAILYK
jgi:hypothetical protein